MKLSWKLFFITTPVFLLFLTVFGTWLIQGNFESSLEQTIESCMVENQMFQNSYELTMYSLSAEQQEQTSLEKIIQSFHRKNEANGENTRILDAQGEILYADHDFFLAHNMLAQMDEGNNIAYEMIREKGETYLVVVCRTSLGDYIETTKKITPVFLNRMEQYDKYQTGVLVFAVLAGTVILLAIFLVMKNMQKLSKATRKFADGQYQTRVTIVSHDEVGRLAEDFNWMAEQMNQQMEKLQEEVQRQEEFTVSFAHELKTPLTSIIGYADTIRQMDLSPEELQMCADYIYHQGKRLQSLSYKLLELAMTDKQEIDYRKIPVLDFLQEIERTVREMLAEKRISLEISAKKGNLYGDRDLLFSLLLNLIDNGRKASKEGATIRILGDVLPGGYSLIVEDEGCGIPQSELAKVTEAFYMVDKSRARREGGAGLGLALCRKIVEMHQGSWEIESEPQKGTRVKIFLALPEGMHRRRRSG